MLRRGLESEEPALDSYALDEFAHGTEPRLLVCLAYRPGSGVEVGAPAVVSRQATEFAQEPDEFGAGRVAGLAAFVEPVREDEARGVARCSVSGSAAKLNPR